MRLSAALAALPLCLTLGACQLGPNFRHPDAPKAAGYLGAGENAQVGAEASAAGHANAAIQHVDFGRKLTGDWWTLFHSSALNDVIAQAFADNDTVEAARNSLEQARQVVIATSGDLYPHLSASAGIEREKIDLAAFGFNSSGRVINLYQIGPRVNYAVDVFGGLARSIEQQQALTDVSRAQFAAAYLTLSGNVVRQAVDIASFRAQIDALNRIVADDQRNLDLVKVTQQAGQGTQLDVVTAQAQLDNDRGLLPPIEQGLSLARHALSAYLGRTPAEWTPPDFDLAQLSLPEALPVSLPSDLVRDRPDILAAEARLHAASAAIGVATAAQYPHLDLAAAISQQATGLPNFFTGLYNAFDVGASLTQPIFEGGTLKARKEGAVAAYKSEAAAYRQTVVQAFVQVADALTGLSHDRDAIAIQQQALGSAQESLRLTRLSYSAGNVGVVQVVEAERLNQQAQLGLVRAQAQRYLDTVQLFVAMGRGWWNDGEQPPKPTRS